MRTRNVVWNGWRRKVRWEVGLHIYPSLPDARIRSEDDRGIRRESSVSFWEEKCHG